MISKVSMPPAPDRRNLQDPQQILEALESFLQAANSPVLAEDGRPPMPIVRDRLRIEATSTGVILESWGPEGAVVRRLTAIASASRSKLELKAKRFAQADIRVSIVDAAASTGTPANAHSSEAFLHRLLAREFTRVRIARLSGHSDLQQSLSGRHVRCLIEHKRLSWAVVAAPPLSSADACDCAITTGLLWLDALRKANRRRPVVGLRIFLPIGKHERTCRILHGLNSELAAYELYVYDSRGNVQQVDPANIGNAQTIFRAYYRPTAFTTHVADWIAELEARPTVESVPQANGSLSLRVLGLEFALAHGADMVFGLDAQTVITPANFSEVLRLADHLSSIRTPRAADRTHPLYRAYPERWLESRIRKSLSELDHSLGGTAPVYSQPAASAGTDRSIVDLVTADRSGRLAVLEVKATVNLQLPIQALDYWLAIRELTNDCSGLITSYFPNQQLSQALPRLILIAPALEFHPKTELITSYFANHVPVERIGLNMAWRASAKKRFHQRDRERPDSFSADLTSI